MNTKLKFSSEEHSEIDSKTEQAYVFARQMDWKNDLPLLAFVSNLGKHLLTMFSPFELKYGFRHLVRIQQE